MIQELVFFDKIHNGFQKIKNQSFNLFWSSITFDNQPFIDITMINKLISSVWPEYKVTYEDWQILSRRILNNPKTKVYKLGKVEMKMFMHAF